MTATIVVKCVNCQQVRVWWTLAADRAARGRGARRAPAQLDSSTFRGGGGGAPGGGAQRPTPGPAPANL